MILDDVNVYYRNGRKPWMVEPEAKFALESCILEAGDGDYLEIGVLSGGSLMFAALLKKFLGHSGYVYGIEKSDGLKPAHAELAKQLGVEVNIIYKPSYPWPTEAENIRPVVAFIDGDHLGDMPQKDWYNLKDRTQRFVLFHDFSPDHTWTDVETAVNFAKHDPNWRFVTTSHSMAVFERCVAS